MRPAKHSRHPVQTLLRESIYVGQKPDRADIDALNLPPDLRARFNAAVDEALKIRAAGNRVAANAHAEEESAGLRQALPDELRDPASYHRDPLTDVTDPRELAAAVGSFNGLRGPFGG